MPNSTELAQMRESLDSRFKDLWDEMEKLRSAHQSHQIEWTKHITGLSGEMSAMRQSLDRLDGLVAFAIKVMIVGIAVIAASAGPQGIEVIAKAFGHVF